MERGNHSASLVLSLPVSLGLETAVRLKLLGHSNIFMLAFLLGPLWSKSDCSGKSGCVIRVFCTQALSLQAEQRELFGSG